MGYIQKEDVELLTINNRYHCIKLLGTGGMGQVFYAHDLLHEHREVALKQINHQAINPESLRAFRTEFEAMTRLKHPHLAQVYDFGKDTESGDYYIALEYIAGESINEILQKRETFSLAHALALFVDMCRAVAFMHSRQIIHRDINPNNVMITHAHGTIKLMDFGLADLQRSDKHIRGTPLYMAPEVLHGEITERIDIYSLGITLIQMLTGDLSMARTVSTQEIISVLRDEQCYCRHMLKMLQQLNGCVLRDIVARMITFHPGDRYQSATEIIEAINLITGSSYPFETNETKSAYVLGAGFVGREQELYRLKQYLSDDALLCRVLWIQAGAGVGKSRLFSEFRNWCLLNEIAFFEGSCYESITRQFGPFLSILNELLLQATPLEIEKYGPELKKILPDHSCFSNMRPIFHQDPHTEHAVVVRSIVQFIIESTQKYNSGCVLYLNDLHWSDEGSAELVDLLLREMGKKGGEYHIRFHLFISSRLEQIETLDVIKSRDRFDILRLVPFSRQTVYKYIEGIFGSGAVGPRFLNAVDSIHVQVGGNPFYLQEVIRSAICNNDIVRETAYWELAQSSDGLKVPDNLEDLIGRRLQEMTFIDKEWETIRILTVLNRGISYDELNRIIPTEPSFLTKIEQRELIRSEIKDRQLEYRLTHDLIRAKVLEQITDTYILHEKVADTLEKIHSDTIDRYTEELAYHYSHTKNRNKALYYLEKAAKQAKENYENRKALQFFDTLLTLLGEAGDDTQKKIDVALEKIAILWMIGKLQKIIELANDTIQLIEKTGNTDSSKMTIAYYFLCLSAVDSQDPMARDYCEAFYRIARSTHDAAMMTRALNSLGNYYFIIERDCEKSIECHKQGIVFSQQTPDKLDLWGHLSNVSRPYYATGEFQKAIECQKQAKGIAERSGVNKREIALICCLLGKFHASVGDYSTAFELFEKSIALSDTIEAFPMQAYALANKGMTLLGLKRISEAQQACRQALQLLSDVDEWEHIYTIKLFSAKLAYAMIDRKSGIQCIKELLQKARTSYEKAELLYELWKMNKEEVTRTEAIVLNKDICRKTPDYYAKKRLEELEREKKTTFLQRRKWRWGDKHSDFF